MPASFPSRDLTNQYISSSYQDVVQNYTPGSGDTNQYFLDGLGNVILVVSSASITSPVITSDVTSSMSVLSSSYSTVAGIADVALIADTASVAVISDFSISSSWASSSISASFAKTASYAESSVLSAFEFPLYIPSYTGYQVAIHPSILDLGTSGFGGYRYWMAYTPYPPAATENPSLVCSHDGVNWNYPSGTLLNPVFNSTDGAFLTSSRGITSSFSFWSDSDIFMSPDNLTMSMIGKLGLAAAANYGWALKQTTNGVDWSQIDLILISNMVSIQVVDIGTGYRWFGVNNGISFYDTAYTNFSGSFGAPVATTGVAEAWHLGVQQVPELNTYWAVYNTAAAATDLRWATSSANALTWSVQSTNILPSKSGYMFDKRGYYKPDFIVESASPPRITLYASTLGNGALGDSAYSDTPYSKIGRFHNIPIPCTGSSSASLAYDPTKSIPIKAYPDLNGAWEARIPGNVNAEVISANVFEVRNAITASRYDKLGVIRNAPNGIFVGTKGWGIGATPNGNRQLQINPALTENVDVAFGSDGDGNRPTLRFLSRPSSNNDFFIQLGKSSSDVTTPLTICSLNSSNNPIGSFTLNSLVTTFQGYNGTFLTGSRVNVTGSISITGSFPVALRVGGRDGPNLLFVSGSGRVGIGTSIPTNSLDVIGNISCSAITASLLYGTASYAISASYAPNVGGVTPGESYDISASWASSSLSSSYTISASYADRTLLSNSSSYLSGSSLHVTRATVGSMSLAGTFGTANDLNVNSIIGAGPAAGEIRSYQTANFWVSLKTDTGTNRSGIFRSNSNFFVYYDTLNGDTVVNATFATTPIVFKVNNVVKATMSASGDWGLGTATPRNKLDVVGNISCSVITASLLRTNTSTGSTAPVTLQGYYQVNIGGTNYWTPYYSSP